MCANPVCSDALSEIIDGHQSARSSGALLCGCYKIERLSASDLIAPAFSPQSKTLHAVRVLGVLCLFLASPVVRTISLQRRTCASTKSSDAIRPGYKIGTSLWPVGVAPFP